MWACVQLFDLDDIVLVERVGCQYKLSRQYTSWVGVDI